MKTAFKSSFLRTIKKIRDEQIKSDIDHRKDIYKHFP